ncbi:S41 family peptidase [Moraxella sp. K127]|nr:S41 family peptidase [Moraxella sp. K127]MBE9597502.1 S41 family peptidase [Moraxella sp. K2450]MDI4484031.1 S41 family peptidase [Moraxella lacunata]MDI4508492.1 S41 family peptidase [Moraxella lacunata]
MTSHAELPKAISTPINKVANLLGFGDDVQADSGLDVEAETGEQTDAQDPTSPTLDALESKPNTLHGIEGLHQGRVPLGAVSPNTLKTFVSVVDLVRRDYVEEVSDEKLFENAMSGMLTGLDSHAEFLDKDAFANLQSFTAGNVANIGLSAVWQDDESHWVITSVHEDSSAKRAGVKVGDYLHQVGETKLDESHSENDVKQLLNGIAGTQVDIVVSHAGRSKRRLTAQRNEVLKSNVETAIVGGVVIIKLPVFQNNTRQQILESLGQAGVPITGVILDVRNNPGGVLESAGAVASLFMRNQTLVQVAGRQGVERELRTEGSPLLIDLPVMILQNRYSASAAEVLASSLQSQKRALIVGETSYGKGSVQSVIPIGDGQAVKMTTAHYLTADGQRIDGVGVVPDVAFDRSAELAPTMMAISGDVWLSQALILMDGAKLETGVDFAPVGGF